MDNFVKAADLGRVSSTKAMPEFSFSPSTKILHFLLCDFILEMVLLKNRVSSFYILKVNIPKVYLISTWIYTRKANNIINRH